MSSFDRIETASRAREIISRVASKQVAAKVPPKLIGRMMSVDLPRLRGTVWFPGDAQVTPVEIFANAVPADWQHKVSDRIGQDSSLEGFGAEVVVERLNGILYVTQVLTGGTAALDFKSLGMSVMSAKGAPTQAGGPTADAIVDIAGNPYETFINCQVTDETLDVDECIAFGPFMSYTERTPDKGWMEITVRCGTAIRHYKFLADIAEQWDIDYPNFTEEVWVRLVPDQQHDGGFETDNLGSSVWINTEFSLDVCFRRTAYGNTENFVGYREMWMRIVKENQWHVDGGSGNPGIDAFVTLRATNIQRGRSLGGRELFMQEKLHRASAVTGYVGVHDSAIVFGTFSAQFNDNFARTVSSGWGKGESIGTRDWTVTGAGGTYLVDGEHGCIDISAVSTTYEVMATDETSTNPDITFTVQSPVVATGASIRVALIVAHETATNNRYLLGIDFKTAGAIDVTARRRTGGVSSDMSSPTAAGFTYAANDRIKVRCYVKQNTSSEAEFRVKAWKEGTNEPITWQKSFTWSTSLWLIGRTGFSLAAEGANTNTKPFRMKFGPIQGHIIGTSWDGPGETWLQGPYRSSSLRLANDLQKTWTQKGEFTWDGTYLKLPEELYFTGVGKSKLGLSEGRAYVRIPSGIVLEAIPKYPYRDGDDSLVFYDGDEGIPLEEYESLWLGVQPGETAGNLMERLFIVDSRRAWQFYLPEWAVHIATRGPSTANPPIRLGNGQSLDQWRAIPFATNWSNFGSGYETGAYRMEANGIVRMRGVVRNTSSTTATTTIFTLPAGFRPPSLIKMFLVISTAVGSSGFSRIDIPTSGTVTPAIHFSGGGSGFLNLEQVVFSTVP